MLDLGGEVSELGSAGRGRPGDLCRLARRAAVVAQQEPGHETGRDRDRDHRSEPELRSPDHRGEAHPTALTVSRGHDRAGPGRGRVEHLDLVRDARVGDVDALRVSRVDDGEAAAGEPDRPFRVPRGRTPHGGERARERVRRDREVGPLRARGDARRQVADEHRAGVRPRQLVGDSGLFAEPVDRLAERRGERAQAGGGNGHCARSSGPVDNRGRFAVAVAEDEPQHGGDSRGGRHSQDDANGEPASARRRRPGARARVELGCERLAQLAGPLPAVGAQSPESNRPFGERGLPPHATTARIAISRRRYMPSRRLTPARCAQEKGGTLGSRPSQPR